MKTYSDKLKDPRWQKKRLEIFERDGWECQVCGDKKATLAVHHRDYVFGKEPWDYPNSSLVTLCEHCHEEEFGRAEIEQGIIRALRKHFLTNDLSIIEDAFESMAEYKRVDLWMIAETIRWFLTKPEVVHELTDRCWKYMRSED
jgi:hypothetical protein